MKKIYFKRVMSIVLSAGLVCSTMTEVFFRNATEVYAYEENEEYEDEEENILDREVTIHFKNACNWDNVGVWLYQGLAFKKNICPVEACPAYNTIQNRPIWPGARMTKEEDHAGWYSITATFDDVSQGAVMIFNNLVAETDAYTIYGEDPSDQQFLEDSGLIMDSDLREQTPNQIIRPKFTGTEYWCDYSGDKSSGTGVLLSEQPDSYVNAGDADNTDDSDDTDESKLSISDCSVEFDEDSYTYNGSEIELAMTITDDYYTLENEEDYIVSYLDNVNAGTATAIITGCGDYKGTISEKFIIEPKSILDAEVVMSESTFEYDGLEKQPDITVTDDEVLLHEGTEYTISYRSNIKVGKAKVTITGQGNYFGSIVKEFDIVGVTPRSVKLSQTKLVLGVGETFSLQANVNPRNAKTSYKWSTSNKSIVTVSKGKVKAVKTGTAVITVKTSNGKKAVCKVTVKKAPKSVKLNKTKLTIKKGECYTLRGTLNSDSAIIASDIQWKTSSTKAVKLQKQINGSCKVTAKNTGVCVVTFTTYNGKKAMCKITVKN